jgi:hypothetical protein
MAICTSVYSQSCQLTGEIVDEKSEPLASVTTVLLNPSDSTMLYFAVTGNNGRFEIKNIKKGSYLLQTSLVGYKTNYRNITLPVGEKGDIGSVTMSMKVYDMGEVTVTTERIPMKIIKDTIEYDAKAYKVKPDAVVEDLLKTLPGIEVDRSGNIKAMGEDVNKILVDGKEFFSSDPKVATRNLPADAITKVQYYDNQTDESKFTGINDGERVPTLNFVLEENKKRGIFGDVSAGAGTGGHVAATAKMYKFTHKTQFAALGMYNNINQYGFSLKDYIGSGAGGSSSGSSSPSNFGQQATGTGSNGAAGLNFSVFNSKRDRFFASYLGKGSSRDINEASTTKNYLSDGNYLVDASTEQVKRDTSHNLTFGLRKQIGEKQNVILNGGISYSSASNPLSSLSESYLNDTIINRLSRTTNENKSGLSGNADASYMLKINSGKTILKIAGNADYSGSNSKTKFLNQTEYENLSQITTTNQFYNLNTASGSYSGGGSLMQRVSKLSYIELAINAYYSSEKLERRQGNNSDEDIPDSLLSPDFLKTDKYICPGLSWKRVTNKSKFMLALNTTIGEYTSTLNNDKGFTTSYKFFTPVARWQMNYKPGRRFTMDVSASVNTPQASQLLPVVNNVNSLSLFYGNRALRPEYVQNARITWWVFDQFSFTTLLAGINMAHTHDKIGYSIETDENLKQTSTLINVDDDWTAGGNIDFSTPLKTLGIKINLNLDESYDRGISFINETENICSSFTHKISLTVDNRKKDKWDIKTGSTISLTNTRYSVQSSLNDNYRNISWFEEVRYTPGSHFSFMTSADITNYSAENFNESQIIPLLGAEMSYYFLKNQRASFTLSGADLLNRDTGIERTSEMNYLSEKRSNVVGRYVLLTFRYRLNRFGNHRGGMMGMPPDMR